MLGGGGPQDVAASRGDVRGRFQMIRVRAGHKDPRYTRAAPLRPRRCRSGSRKSARWAAVFKISAPNVSGTLTVDTRSWSMFSVAFTVRRKPGCRLRSRPCRGQGASRGMRGIPDNQVGLTPKGHDQAAQTGVALREVFGVFDYTYHSGYQRTIKRWKGLCRHTRLASNLE